TIRRVQHDLQIARPVVGDVDLHRQVRRRIAGFARHADLARHRGVVSNRVMRVVRERIPRRWRWRWWRWWRRWRRRRWGYAGGGDRRRARDGGGTEAGAVARL